MRDSAEIGGIFVPLLLPRPPRSCPPLAVAVASRLAKRPRQRLGLDAAGSAKIMGSEEGAGCQFWRFMPGWPALQSPLARTGTRQSRAGDIAMTP
jgi:hypothetical protein